MLASRTLLVRRLSVGADDRVTNRTLGLAFHRACGVSSPGGEAVDEAAVLHVELVHVASLSWVAPTYRECNHALAIPQPALPLFFVHGNAVDSHYLR